MADEQMWLLGENGALLVFDVPLPFGIAHRLNRGDLTRVNPDGSPWSDIVPEPEPAPDAAGDAPPLPKRTENRAVWTDFAIGQGMEREQAASMTKAELIEALTHSASE